MEIDDVVLAIDVERQRISLGIKQIEKDPFSAYLAQHEKGSIVKGTVLKIEPQGITDLVLDFDKGQIAYVVVGSRVSWV